MSSSPFPSSNTIAGLVERQRQSTALASAVPWWEQLCAAYVLMMLTGALIGPILAPDQGENPILRLFWLPSYAITAGLVVLNLKHIIRVWPAVLLLGLLCLLAFASHYWSLDPATTKRRAIAMAINGSFAVYLGARFTGANLPRLLALNTLWMGVLSVMFVIALPQIGVHHGVNDGLWRGIWYEKNQMGWVMVVGGISAMAWQASLPKVRPLPVVCYLLCALLVLATASKTSLLCLAMGSGLIAALWIIRRAGPALGIVAVWFGVVAVIGGWWIWTEQSAFLLQAIGKDPTFTGRTNIWAEVLNASEQRPWLGYGYNAFWDDQSNPANWIRYQTGWIVPSAHNGWLDVLVGLGRIGVALVGLTLGLAYIRHLIRLGRTGIAEGFWSISLLTVIIALSLSESILLSAQSLLWMLCLSILSRGFYPPMACSTGPTPTNRHIPHPVPNPYVGSRLRPSA